MGKIKEQKKLIIPGAIIALLVVVLAIIFINSGSDQRKLNSCLNLGQKYLEEMSYEDAILVFDQAIAIDPKCAQAYLGKAQAQYALGLYEDAVATLREGIEQVDDSTELETFLRQILDELSATTVEEETVVVEEKEAKPLFLNYTSIMRSVDTQDPEIQLELLGEEEERNLVWESTNPECASVSDTGLVQCHSVMGEAVIVVTDNGQSDNCYIWISDNPNEGETLRYEMEDGTHLLASPKEDGEGMEIDVEKKWDDEIGRWVYYAGDITIPEVLQYKGREIPVTGMSYMFMYCEDMTSISIPAKVEGIESSWSNPYGGCYELTNIDVNEENPNLKSVDGVLYSKDGKKLISYPAAKPGDTFTIPKEVEEVSDRAFKACKNLKQILVEEGNARYESRDGVLIEDGNKLLAYPVGNDASTYEVPDGIISLGNDAFFRSGIEEFVCKSMEYINVSAWLGECQNLQRIEGGSATKSIWIYAEDVVEIAGIDEMNQLESLSLNVSNREADDKAGNLQEFGKLENLKELTISGVNDLSGWGWLKGLTNLERFSITSSKISGSDLQEMQKIPHLQSLSINGEMNADDVYKINGLDELTSLEINGIGEMKDFSWVMNLPMLSSLSILCDGIETEDITPLLELPDLQFVSIGNYSENSGLNEAFEKMREENPDMAFYYYEYGSEDMYE